MADNSNSGGNTLLAIIVGALLVIVIGFFVLRGTSGTGGAVHAPSVSVSAPSVPHS
jgi:hypothetical protein